MSGGDKISPNNTYVLDEALLDEMDNIELTGLVRELSDHFVTDEKVESRDDAEAEDAEAQPDQADGQASTG